MLTRWSRAWDEPASLKAAQLAYVEQNSGKVLFNKESFLLRREFLGTKPHLLAEPPAGAQGQSAASTATRGEL